MRRILSLFAVAFVLAVSLILLIFPITIDRSHLPKAGDKVTVEGKVRRIEEAEEGFVFYVRIFSDRKINVIVNVPITEGEDIRLPGIGNTVRVSGKCMHFDSATNDGMFDSAIYYKILGMDYRITNADFSVIDGKTAPLSNALFMIRRCYGSVYSKYLSSDNPGVIRSMLLGEKKQASKSIKDLYKQSGISHILAISGLHISLLGMSIYKLLGRCNANKSMAALFSFFFLICFGIMTGNSASTIRSTVMFSLFLLSEVIGRTYDMITACSFSAVVLLILQPLYLYHSGFLLSFAAVTGIALLSPVFSAYAYKREEAEVIIVDVDKLIGFKNKIKKAVKASIVTSLSVIAASLPIQLWFYYGYSTYGIFLNILIVPLAGVILIAALLGGTVSVILPFTKGLFLIPCDILMNLTKTICELAVKLPAAYPIAGRPAAWQIVIYYALIAVFSLVTLKKKKDKKHLSYLLLFIPVLAAAVLCIRLRISTTVTMLDVGQGDGLVIESADGSNILIDGGSTSVKELARYRVVPYLQSHGITRIDYAFISHADKDHYSAVLEMIQNEDEFGIKIKTLVLTKFAKTDEGYDELKKAASDAGIDMIYVSTGDSFMDRDIRLNCLYPEKSTKAEGNDQSMVMLFECKGTGMLFTGDLTEEKEKEALPESFNGADILKTGHHGSKYSSSGDFLDKISPEYALISAGKDNRYGHPSKVTLERLKEREIQSFCTINTGQIRVIFKKRGYLIKTYIANP